MSSMRGYLAKRTLYALMTVFAIATVNFLVFMVMPGDPVSIIAETRILRPEQVEQLISQFGLNRNPIERYFIYIGNMFTFNFGFSYYTKHLVLQDILTRLPETLMLLGVANLLSVIVGLVMGLLAAGKRGGIIDRVVLFFGLAGYALPGWWIGLVLLTFLGYVASQAVGFQLFPLRGSISVPPPTDPIQLVLDRLWHMILPVTALTISNFGGIALIMRNQILDVMTEDYIITARAKGLTERTVLYKHALRNAMPPLITIIALTFAFIFVGLIITETVFSWPGLGQYLLLAVGQPDFPALQGIFFLVALSVVLANYLSDILYGVFDPRIRLQR